MYYVYKLLQELLVALRPGLHRQLGDLQGSVVRLLDHARHLLIIMCYMCCFV